MHFMQPGSTTIPYCFTSAWTSTFEVQVAVQWPALIAGIGVDADFSRREFVRESKKSAIRTGVGAKAFLPQKMNSHETADEKKRDGDCYGRKSCPKIRRDQMVGKFRDKRSMVRVCEDSMHGGPNKHIQGADERDIHQQPPAKRLGGWGRHFLQHPSAEILQSENVTAPAADKTPEDQRSPNLLSKEDKSSSSTAPAWSVRIVYGRFDGQNRPAP